ncbi:MAG: hypothetical protein AB1696_14190 [Planctomycetota bacterium]
MKLRTAAICVLLLATGAGCAIPAKTPTTAAPDVAKPKARIANDKWQWFKSMFFSPTKELVYLDRWWGRATGHPFPAKNIDVNGNPADSPVFVNRDASKMSLAEIERGPNSDDGPVGKITATKIKESGASPGFFGKDSRGVKYLFKFDINGWPEMATGAEVVGNRLMHALGYNVPEAQIMIMHDVGTKFDGQRCAAVKFVPGEILGPWDFKENRDLREVRTLKLASAWINNTDMKEINSLMTWRDNRLKVYLIDFGNSLGSHSIDPKMPEAGWEYRFDVDEMFHQIFTLGLCGKPFRKDKKPFSPAVGLFDADFDPERWKTNYPVVSFFDATPDDSKWMARRIAAFTDDQIRAAVSAGEYSRKEDADHIAAVLMQRRDAIRNVYLK